jgi:hypothetical protein
MPSKIVFAIESPSSLIMRNLTTRLLVILALATAVSAQTATYRHHGATVLNDLTVTPGDVRSVTKSQLCDPSFHTATVRHVTESEKKAACAEYGLTPTQCTGEKVEIDHLLSLELGGSNDIKNLWPQPYAPKPGAREKDVVENSLHRLVCAGKIGLPEAQKCISSDWVACEQKMNTLEGKR